MMTTIWHVIVEGHYVGSVQEDTEAAARCAALHEFGVSEDRFGEMGPRERNDVRDFRIPPGTEFHVSRA